MALVRLELDEQPMSAALVPQQHIARELQELSEGQLILITAPAVGFVHLRQPSVVEEKITSLKHRRRQR